MKIEKNVKLPQRKDTLRNVAQKMEIGDSILFPNFGKANTFGATLRRVYGNGSARTHKEDDGHCYRVWRVK